MKKNVPFIFIIILLAFGLRVYAALTLPTDYDEPVYYTAARYYAESIRNGQPQDIPLVEFNYEHPTLAKLVYGVALSALPSDGYISGDVWQFFMFQEPLPETWEPLKIFFLRLVSSTFGTMTVALLSLISPLAGLALAIDSFAIKFTSVIYLEAIPMFFALLATWLFSEGSKWMRTGEQVNLKGRGKELALLFFSSISLGLAAACKYQYGMVGIAIVLFYAIWILAKKPKELIRYLIPLVYGIIALGSFFAADPYLYSNPVSNLFHSLGFSFDYQNGEAVRVAGYPFFQPLIWLSQPVTNFLMGNSQPMPSRGTEFLFKLDTLIFILALIGLPKLFRDHPLFFTWLVAGLVFLLVWNTKWPQYSMLVIVPLCLSSSAGIKTIGSYLQKRFSRKASS